MGRGLTNPEREILLRAQQAASEVGGTTVSFDSTLREEGKGEIDLSVGHASGSRDEYPPRWLQRHV